MKYDDILVYLGQFGKYQKLRYALLCLPPATVALQTMIFVYTLADSQHRCAVPGLPNDTFTIQNEAHRRLVQAFIPVDTKADDFSSCHVFNISYDGVALHYNDEISRHEDANTSSPFQRGVRPCQAWVYDKSQYTSTLTSKFDIVCDRKLSKSHAQMIFMAGNLIGTLVVGPPADLFGRKKTLMVALILHILASFSIAFSPSFTFFTVTLFINGVSCSCLYTICFVLGMELVGPDKRRYAGYVIAIAFGVAIIVLAGLAFLIRNWQHLQLATSSISIFYFLYYWLLDESPRWLISRKRYPEAKVLLEKMARTNGKELPAHAMQWDNMELDKGEKRVGLWKICSYPKLVLRTLIIFFIWVVCAMTYYGLGLNVGDLAGSVYLNSFFYGLVEILSYVMCMCLMDRTGRKLLLVTCMMSAGVACILSPLATVYINYQWVSITLAIVGKFGVAAAFGVIWVYSTEVFPTVIRNSAVASCSLLGRIGAGISPYIANMGMTVPGNTGKILPFAVFGVTALVAGLLAMVLPETKDITLPESFEDVNDFKRCKIQKPKAIKVDCDATELNAMIATDEAEKDTPTSGQKDV